MASKIRRKKLRIVNYCFAEKLLLLIYNTYSEINGVLGLAHNIMHKKVVPHLVPYKFACCKKSYF